MPKQASSRIVKVSWGNREACLTRMEDLGYEPVSIAFPTRNVLLTDNVEIAILFRKKVK